MLRKVSIMGTCNQIEEQTELGLLQGNTTLLTTVLI